MQQIEKEMKTNLLLQNNSNNMQLDMSSSHRTNLYQYKEIYLKTHDSVVKIIFKSGVNVERCLCDCDKHMRPLIIQEELDPHLPVSLLTYCLLCVNMLSHVPAIPSNPFTQIKTNIQARKPSVGTRQNGPDIQILQFQ